MEYSVNLCPVCGLPSNSTSVICPRHQIIIYNFDGKVVDYIDEVTISDAKRKLGGAHGNDMHSLS